MGITNNVVPIRKPFECAVCGGTEGQTTHEAISFDYGKGDAKVTLRARVPVDSCHKCGEEVLGDGAEGIRHDTVCRHLGVLTPREIKELRKSMGMSRDRLAEVSGIGSASLARWENGSHIQNVALDRYLRLLSKSAVLPELLKIAETDNPESATQPTFRCLRLNRATIEAAERFNLN